MVGGAKLGDVPKPSDQLNLCWPGLPHVPDLALDVGQPLRSSVHVVLVCAEEFLSVIIIGFVLFQQFVVPVRGVGRAVPGPVEELDDELWLATVGV